MGFGDKVVGVNLNNFVIGKSSFSNEIFLGKLSKDRKRWLDRKVITEMFENTALEYFEGNKHKFAFDKDDTVVVYEIACKKTIMSKEEFLNYDMNK